MVPAHFHAPPTKAAIPHLNPKAPAVGPTKAVPGEPSAGPHLSKSKFQTLLDQVGHSPKTQEPGLGAKANKVKSEANEKPKEAKKVETKDPKAETPDAAWLAAFHSPAKAEPVKIEGARVAKPDIDAVSAQADKGKGSKTDRRVGIDAGQVVAWNPGSLETRSVTQAAGTPSKAERSEEKQKVFVVDRRSDKEKEKLRLPGAEAAAQQPVNASVELQNQHKATDPKAQATDVQVVFQTVGGKSKEGFDLKPQNTPVSPRDAASFQQYLVDKGYGQLVDQARIVLKDQNAGEIRMTLYPETLGKVKVSLNLSDNTLAGQIFVENQTVKDVFQSNMDGLLQAFRDGGWSDLSLQVSVGGGGSGNQAGNGQPQAGPQARDYDRQVAASVPDGKTSQIGSWNGQVNLTA